MNREQKTCLLVGMTAIAVMGLFPPWVLESKVGSGKYEKYTLEPGPYSWIGSPPTHVRYEEATARFIDLYRLGVQYFIVIVVTVGLIVILKDTNISSPFRRRMIRLIFFVVSVVLVSIIFYDELSYQDENWIFAFIFFAVIWVLYNIIRLIITLKNRNRSRNGRKKESNNL